MIFIIIAMETSRNNWYIHQFIVVQEVIVASLKGHASAEGGVVAKQIQSTHYRKVF
jgi:hypothetical protein